jgi:hypothetical protein
LLNVGASFKSREKEGQEQERCYFHVAAWQKRWGWLGPMSSSHWKGGKEKSRKDSLGWDIKTQQNREVAYLQFAEIPRSTLQSVKGKIKPEFTKR